MQVTFHFGLRAERERESERDRPSDRAYSKRMKLTGSRGHVIVDAQNRPKRGRLHIFGHFSHRYES